MTEDKVLARWRLKDFDPGAGAPARAHGDDGDTPDWIDIAAPGDVYQALHGAGRLPDPFADENEGACAWVTDREWWQRTQFETPALKPGERLTLVCDGLDTFAAIWLNGEEIARSDNMFRPVEIDITDRVRRGQPNTLAIGFTPTGLVVRDEEPLSWAAVSDAISESKRNLMRKAQFGWGWDWAPRLPTVGIWRPVRLKIRGAAALDSVKFTTLSATKAEARVEVAAHAHGASAATLHVTLTAPSGAVVADETSAFAGNTARIAIALKSPDLWWTHDLGAPALYKLRAELRTGDSIADVQEKTVGVRTIEIDRSPDPDEPGTEFFRFIINGVPIFARGACWIPASSYVATIDADRYGPLIEAAVDGNMNMLRVWGGGIYEHDEFYDLCDRAGVLIWQDFMFACAPYPEESAFAESVIGEVRYQIERLRHHACLALWCGNNENQVINDFARRKNYTPPPVLGSLYYDNIMPKAVAELDPTTPYWPGSPAGGPHANSMRAGDVHNWTVWHGLPPVPDDRPVGKASRTPEGIAYTRYAEDMARFISEYGIQASPSLETLKRCMDESEHYFASPGMLNRIKDRPKDKVNAMLAPVTGLPQTMEQYVTFTQLTQAEGLKFAIEHYRRRMPHCSGSLIWQFNDCWPCVSWSMIDYNGFAKAGYFYTRRAYAPVIASFKQVGDETELWITNETQHAVTAATTIELGAFDSGAVWREEANFNAPAYTSAPVWRASHDKVDASPAHYLNVRAAGDVFPENRLFFAPIKDLARTRDIAPKVDIEQRGANAVAVTIAAEAYLYFTHILTPHGSARFSDNYFDLRPGQQRTIIVSAKDVALKPADIEVNWARPW